jgi:Glycosyl transferase family 2
LRETLMTLAGQSCQHFQLLLVVHSESTEAHQTIVRLVDEFPSDFTKRTTIFTCGRPGRAAPLNEALPHALGEYVAVLDDDDFVFGHWVETFKNLARESPGKLLRATSTRQNIDSLSGDRTRAASWFLMDWPGTYDALSHLIANSTPFMSVAFPRGLFHDLGWRFDEELSTIEDWQLTTRAAMVCGVASTPEVTSIYRWWNKHGSSLFEHPEEEWRKNYNRVIDMLDERPILLPAGTVRRIDGLLQQNNLLLASRDEFAARTAHLEQALSELQNQMIGHGPPLPAVELNSAAYPETRQILLDHINSTSWRLTRPFRWLSNMLRRRPGSGAALDRLPMSADQCAMLVHEIQTSTSWHLSRPVRYIGRMIKQGRHKNGRLH